MRKLLPILLLAFLAVCCAPKATQHDDERPVVAVSSGPEEWLLRNIAGERVKCITLLPPGADPERFEPSVSTMRSLNDARIWFSLATPGFESTLASRLPDNFPDLEIVNVAEGIEPLDGTHRNGDPHLTSSLRNLRTIAYTMTDHLIRLLPDEEEALRENNAALQMRLRTLDDSIATCLDAPLLPTGTQYDDPDINSQETSLSERGTADNKTIISKTEKVDNAASNGKRGAFVVIHPNLTYFANDYALRQIALERDGKEPTPAAMAEALRQARAAGAKVMVMDAAHPNEGAASLARGEGLRVITLSLSDTTILTSLRRLADALQAD